MPIVGLDKKKKKKKEKKNEKEGRKEETKEQEDVKRGRSMGLSRVEGTLLFLEKEEEPIWPSAENREREREREKLENIISAPSKYTRTLLLQRHQNGKMRRDDEEEEKEEEKEE
ncbi:hypothetical protein V1478_017319 [Vespula squamosa]|uniref:Uncharacterized protein n=1 Tax=Vespula squamosa TaxID=30214 RepID=A0ABD1ZXM6_VESSQ